MFKNKNVSHAKRIVVALIPRKLNKQFYPLMDSVTLMAILNVYQRLYVIKENNKYIVVVVVIRIYTKTTIWTYNYLSNIKIINFTVYTLFI